MGASVDFLMDQPSEEFPRPDFNFMIDKTEQLIEEYDITFEGGSPIFADGSNPSFLRALKERLDEDPNYESVIAHLSLPIHQSMT